MESSSSDGSKLPTGGEELEQQAGEKSGVKARRVPEAPTPQEVADHVVLHEPYRAWCPECVAGRGVSDRHVLHDTSQDALAVVGMDYGYMVDQQDASPMFCGKDSKHRWFYACAVPSKGVEHEWTPKHISDQMGPAGHRRMLLRSDKEPALMPLKKRIGLLLTTEYGQEIVPEESATGVSQDNGLAEHAVREVKAKVRSLAHAVKIMLGQAIEPSLPSLAWLIEWAALTMNLGRR